MTKRSLIVQIESIFKTSMSLLSDIANLASLELRLAIVSAVILIVIGLGLLILSFFVWFCVMAILFWGLHSLGMAIFLALITVGILNIVLMIVLILIARRYKDNFSFEVTRRQLQEMFTKEEDQ